MRHSFTGALTHKYTKFAHTWKKCNCILTCVYILLWTCAVIQMVNARYGTIWRWARVSLGWFSRGVEKQDAISVTPVSASGSTYINATLQLYMNRRGGMPGIKSVLLYYNRIMARLCQAAAAHRFSKKQERAYRHTAFEVLPLKHTPLYQA